MAEDVGPSPFPRATQWGIFILLLIGALYFGRDFLLPVVLAGLFAMTVRPFVFWLERRGLPSAVAAFLIMAVAVASLAALLYAVSEPVSRFLGNIESYRHLIEDKVAFIRAPLARLLNLSAEIDNLTALAASPRIQEVAIEQPSLFFQAMTNVSSFTTSVVIALVIALFFLAAGDLFTAKLIYVLPTFSDKKLALTIVRKTASEISVYLLSITAINIGLGAAVGSCLWLLGIPTPLLWGALAALFNFLPYAGPAAVTAMVLIVSILSFDNPLMWLIPPAVVAALAVAEGQFITPTILSRRLSLNTVSVLLAIVFWAWLWGIAGALIAVPLLVVAKVICEQVESLSAIAEFLSGQDPRERNGNGQG